MDYHSELPWFKENLSEIRTKNSSKGPVDNQKDMY